MALSALGLISHHRVRQPNSPTMLYMSFVSYSAHPLYSGYFANSVPKYSGARSVGSWHVPSSSGNRALTPDACRRVWGISENCWTGHPPHTLCSDRLQSLVLIALLGPPRVVRRLEQCRLLCRRQLVPIIGRIVQATPTPRHVPGVVFVENGTPLM